jgi:biotin transport system substrate-specific component
MMSISTTATLRGAYLRRSTALTQTALVIGGVGFLAVLAQIAIPVPGSPVPVTGQTLGALLLGTAYGASLGFTTFASYLIVGILGAPVFASGAHGLAKLTGATGGYLVGMLLASALTGYLAGRKWDQRISTAIPAILLGDAIIFTFGLIWLHHAAHATWTWTFSKGLAPFVLGEVIKIAIASTALPTLWRFVPHQQES